MSANQDTLLTQLAASVSEAQDLEGLTRPMLALLERMTGLLTGLANRRAMEQTLARMLARAEHDKTAVHIAPVELDAFKAINDTHGHDCGDRFPMHIAQKLSGAMRPGDLVERTGGDQDGHAALNRADEAMYEAKKRRKAGR